MVKKSLCIILVLTVAIVSMLSACSSSKTAENGRNQSETERPTATLPSAFSYEETEFSSETTAETATSNISETQTVTVITTEEYTTVIIKPSETEAGTAQTTAAANPESTVKATTEKAATTKKVTTTEAEPNYAHTAKGIVSVARRNMTLYSVQRFEVAEITNGYRLLKGRSALTLDSDLSLAASIRAAEIASTGHFAHERPDGSAPYTVLSDLGLRHTNMGENLAKGQLTAADACHDWRNSGTHYSNMINRRYNKIGVGVAVAADGTYYWCQIFSA